jgi:hypothetical protein
MLDPVLLSAIGDLELVELCASELALSRSLHPAAVAIARTTQEPARALPFTAALCIERTMRRRRGAR